MPTCGPLSSFLSRGAPPEGVRNAKNPTRSYCPKRTCMRMTCGTRGLELYQRAAAYTEGAHVFAWLAMRSDGRALVFCDGRLAELRGIARPPFLTCGVPEGRRPRSWGRLPHRWATSEQRRLRGHARRWCQRSSNATIASVIAASSSLPVRRLLSGPAWCPALVLRAGGAREPEASCSQSCSSSSCYCC